MNETVTTWTRMMQDFAQSVLRRNPHLIARPHQVGWTTKGQKDQEMWNTLPCRYGKGCEQGHGAAASDKAVRKL